MIHSNEKSQNHIKNYEDVLTLLGIIARSKVYRLPRYPSENHLESRFLIEKKFSPNLIVSCQNKNEHKTSNKKMFIFFSIFTDGFGGIQEDRTTLLVIDRIILILF